MCIYTCMVGVRRRGEVIYIISDLSEIAYKLMSGLKPHEGSTGNYLRMAIIHNPACECIISYYIIILSKMFHHKNQIRQKRDVLVE